MTPTQLQTLKAELTTDPRGYGYSAMSDSQIADALNLVRDGTNGGPAVSVNKGVISTQDLVECVVQSEMPSNAAQRDWLIMVCAGDRVRTDAGSTTRNGLLAIFGAATTTRANLTAAATRNGSRAEELLGVNVTVNYLDVAAARNS